MPILTDEELQDLKDQVEKAEDSKQAAIYQTEKAIEDEQEKSRKFKIATIILGIIALLGLIGTIYFMKFSNSNMPSQKEYNSEIVSYKEKISSLEETIQSLSINQELDAEDPKEDAGSNFVNFREIKSGGYNKYAVGNFETLKEAKKFRREMVKLGFRNAFIASYKNEKRIKIEEAW